ncbi:MAG: glycoside hydrolase family 2 TIM barrel-domain containing protein [Alistipes sp.]
MRTITTLFALILFSVATAQDYSDPTFVAVGRERPRSEITAYPTRESAVATTGKSAYLQPLTWTQTNDTRGTRFTTTFTSPLAWANRQTLLRLASASHAYEVIVNDKVIGYTQNGNIPAEYNLTKASTEGINSLVIRLIDPSVGRILESFEHPATPTLGRAEVLSQSTIRVRDLLLTTRPADQNYVAEMGVVVKTDALNPKSARIQCELRDAAGSLVLSDFRDISLAMRGEDTLRFIAHIPQPQLWNTETPTLYNLSIKTLIEGRAAEYFDFKVGFRSVSHQEGELWVNNQPVKLQVKKISPTLSTDDLIVLKQEGYNTLQLQPGVARDGFYDDCDLLGLYVIVQAPINTSGSGRSIRKGANPSNQPKWHNAYIDRTEGSYHTTKRHPAVVAFSLAQDSANGINLYNSYLNLKKLEAARPILYPAAAGEWNTDKLIFDSEPSVQ